MLAKDAYCELSFSPNVKLIATVRRFVGEFYARILDDDEITSRLVVATHELLENAVKYSADGQSSIRIGVEAAGEEVKVSIETRNITAGPNRKELDDLLAEMRASPHRDGFYQTLIARSSKRVDGSGLGLARIYAESLMDLSCEITDNVVKLRAETRFPMKATKA